MSTYELLIVDDDAHTVESLIDILQNNDRIAAIHHTTDSRKAIQIVRNNPVTLVFLDILMPHPDGLTLAKELSSDYPDLSIVFITHHIDYALRGYELYPLDFIPKPINPLRLKKTIAHFESLKRPPSQENEVYINKKISVKSKGIIYFIEVAHIKFIEKNGRKCIIHYAKNKEVSCTHTLGELEKTLGGYGFFRPHQSFLIPIQKIHKIKPDKFTNAYMIQLDNTAMEIPVSKNKYTELIILVSAGSL